MGGSTRARTLGLLPVVVLLVGLTALVLFFYPEQVRPPVFVFEFPPPFSFAHSLFLSVSAIVLAYFFGRGFLGDGSIELLVLGGGSLVLGLGFLLSQILGNQPFGGPNQLVGISGVTFLVSGLLYGAFAAISFSGRASTTGRRKTALVLEYSAGIGSVLATVLVFETNLAPIFFEPGVGPTSVRGLTLLTATILFAATSVVLAHAYSKSKDLILYSFSLGLASISVGFLSAILGRIPGGLFSWLGRLSVGIGGIYFILAIIEGYRSGRR